MASDDLEIELDLLHRLLTRREHVAASALAGEAGRGVDEVRRSLARLGDAGCVFDEHPHLGVRLVEASLNRWADYIERRRRGGIGRRMLVYRQTSSTQDVARRLAVDEGASAAGAVVVADHQTAGRGRLGRRWYDAPGRSLAMTAVVDGARFSADRLSLAACCALTAAVEQVAAVPAQIRWPNDVLVEGRKIAGILIETVGRVALIGIGVNLRVAPGDLPADDAGRPLHAGGLADLAGPVHVDRLRLLDALLEQLALALDVFDDARLHRHWLDRSCLAQQRITVEHDGRRLTGRVVDLDPQHGLILHVDHGPIVTLPAATTSLV